jgi:hypothetical protein
LILQIRKEIAQRYIYHKVRTYNTSLKAPKERGATSRTEAKALVRNFKENHSTIKILN